MIPQSRVGNLDIPEVDGQQWFIGALHVDIPECLEYLARPVPEHHVLLLHGCRGIPDEGLQILGLQMLSKIVVVVRVSVAVVAQEADKVGRQG